VKVNPSWFVPKVKERWDDSYDSYLLRLAKEKFENWKIIARIATDKLGMIVTPFFAKQRVLPLMKKNPQRKTGAWFSKE